MTDLFKFPKVDAQLYFVNRFLKFYVKADILKDSVKYR